MNVPKELSKLDQWVIWRLQKRGGRSTKVPYRAADGRKASSTNPADWASLDVALEAMDRLEADGIGFVFSATDPYCGVDLDDCFVDGVMHEAASALVESLSSYTELSPSGSGVHVIVKGSVEGFRRRTSKTPWGGNLEAYDSGRYFTFTGESLNGLTIRKAELDQDLLDQPGISDQSGGHWLEDARKSEKFVALFDDGDISEYGDDHSSADLALVNLLVHFIGEDRPHDVFHAFKASALYRGQAKSGGDDYVLRTIQAAMHEAGGSEEESQPSTRKFDREVTKALRALEVREEARRRMALRGLPDEMGLSSVSLTEQLAMPDVEGIFRIEDMHPVGGNVLLIAERKSGKTALLLNILKAIADEKDLFGRFGVTPIPGNIAIFNYEERESHWLRHAAKLGIINTDRVFPQHRRGDPNLPIWDRKGQDEVVQWMIDHEIVYWIMDPAAVAWQGLVDNENDNSLVTAFTVALDQVKQRAGVQELVLTHHTGRVSGETRGRGAMRLEDWADALWYMERDEKTNQRSMWADGRDVDVERFDLNWNDWTFTAGEAVSEHKQKEAVQSDKELKAMATELLDEAGEAGITKSKLVVALRDLGVKMSKERLLSKLSEYARSPATSIGVRIDGQVHTYYYKQSGKPGR